MQIPSSPSEDLLELIAQYEQVFGGSEHYKALEQCALSNRMLALRVAIGTRTPLPYLQPTDTQTSGMGHQCRDRKICDAFFRRARIAMVKGQLRRPAWAVTNRNVLRAMRKVPREVFVPDLLKPFAYHDRALPIGWGQTISQPYMVGLMTELLSPTKEDRILEIGTGSGYQTAILAELAKAVYSIEIIPDLVTCARRTISQLGYENVFIRWGDGSKGWIKYAPFDGIVLTCATDHLPEPLVMQLKPGGRAIIPMGDHQGQWLTVFSKKEHGLKKTSVIPVRFVPMLSEIGNPTLKH